MDRKYVGGPGGVRQHRVCNVQLVQPGGGDVPPVRSRYRSVCLLAGEELARREGVKRKGPPPRREDGVLPFSPASIDREHDINRRATRQKSGTSPGRRKIGTSAVKKPQFGGHNTRGAQFLGAFGKGGYLRRVEVAFRFRYPGQTNRQNREASGVPARGRMLRPCAVNRRNLANRKWTGSQALQAHSGFRSR